MRRGRFVSLGTKLVAGMMAIVATASVLVFREVALRERRHLIDAKALAASMVADLFALSVAAPLDFRDPDAAAAELANLRQNSEITHAAAWLAGGTTPFAQFSQPPDPSSDHEHARLTVRDDRVEVVRIVKSHEGKPIGSAVVYLSLAAENAAYAATLARTLPMAVLTGLGMLTLLVLLVRRQILLPLDRLVGAARRVQRGEASGALDLQSNDEIGRLARAFDAMSGAIFDREAKLFAANRSLEELFDSMRQGIVVFGPDGRVTSAASRRASTIFALRGGRERPVQGARVVDLLYPDAFDGDPEAAALDQWVALAFSRPASQWRDVAELAPKEVLLFAGEEEEDERLLELELRPIAQDDRVSRIMLLASDATDRRRLLLEVQSQGEAHAREMAALRRLVAGGGQALVDFLRSAEERLDHCSAIVEARPNLAPTPVAEVLQHVHTMRGEARVLELRELAASLDELEDALVKARTKREQADDGATRRIARGLGDASACLERARRMLVAASPLGEAALDQATVRRQDVDRLVEIAGKRDGVLGEIVRRLASRPFGEAASILAMQAPTWATALDKQAVVHVEGRDVLVPPALARVLPGVLSHLVRNAIAHGIEAPEEREGNAKPAAGTILLSCADSPAGPVVAVEDDGRGLPIASIVARAKELGLSEAGVDPTSIILHAGFTTAAFKTEIAGLGVGLAAAKADLTTAGYEVLVETRPAGGARFVVAPAARRQGNGERVGT
jgi:HAMP domain-containing protein/HPt (histidine-containing phosphotransfer) domain-containing protein